MYCMTSPKTAAHRNNKRARPTEDTNADATINNENEENTPVKIKQEKDTFATPVKTDPNTQNKHAPQTQASSAKCFPDTAPVAC